MEYFGIEYDVPLFKGIRIFPTRDRFGDRQTGSNANSKFTANSQLKRLTQKSKQKQNLKFEKSASMSK